MTALIFDLDDTLVDHSAAMRRFLTSEYTLSTDAVERLVQVNDRGHRPRAEFCEAVSQETSQSPDLVWETMLARFGNYFTLISPDVLQEAASRFNVALLTNGGSQMQRRKIAALGLDSVIAGHRILVSDEIGAWKPDRVAFQKALEALECEPEDAVMVGDNLVADIGGAMAAGIRSCWVARDQTFPDTSPPDAPKADRPTWTIRSIAQLPDVWNEFTRA